MKYAIISVAVFALTCIGWTTVLVKRAPPPPVVTAPDNAAVAHADTHEARPVAHATPTPVEEHAETADGTDAESTEDSVAVEDGVAEETDRADTSGESTEVADGTVAVASAPTPAREPPVVVAGPTEEEKQAAYKALARIFSQMKAEEAAEVLRHMSDVEVEGVVRNLGARKAAEVLTSLPEQRAAALARRLLIPVEENSR